MENCVLPATVMVLVSVWQIRLPEVLIETVSLLLERLVVVAAVEVLAFVTLRNNRRRLVRQAVIHRLP
jgi:hypothetical protein